MERDREEGLGEVSSTVTASEPVLRLPALMQISHNGLPVYNTRSDFIPPVCPMAASVMAQ